MDVETGATSVLSRCPDLPRHLWTVEEFHRMGEVGLLDADARVELIEGEIVEMAPIGDAHAAISNRLNRLLVLAVGEREDRGLTGFGLSSHSTRAVTLYQATGANCGSQPVAGDSHCSGCHGLASPASHHSPPSRRPRIPSRSSLAAFGRTDALTHALHSLMPRLAQAGCASIVCRHSGASSC